MRRIALLILSILIASHNSPLAHAVVWGDDNRLLVADYHDLSDSPWSSIGKVVTNSGSGTGVMVSPHHMLTAAHVVYDGGLAQNIEFYPGLHGDPERATYKAKAKSVYVPQAYRNRESIAYGDDYALVTLDRPIGSHVGWMNVRSYEDYIRVSGIPVYNGRVLNTAGYPGDRPDPIKDGLFAAEHAGQWMYTCSGDVDVWDWGPNSNLLGFELEDEPVWPFGSVGMDWYHGQSGSPLWVLHAGDLGRHVLGVLSGSGTWQGTTMNIGTRITDAVMNHLGQVMHSAPVSGRGIVGGNVTIDAPPSLADLRGIEGLLSPFQTPSGNEVVASVTMQNLGTAAAGSFTVSFYISDDATITPADHILGEATVPSLDAFSSRGASASGNVPDLPRGEYHVGWIIDSTNHQVEYDEEDNTGLIQGMLRVIGPELTTFPADGETLDFGYVRIGTESSRSIRATNTGDVDTVLTGQFGPASGEFRGAAPESFSVRKEDGVLEQAVAYYSYAPVDRIPDSQTVSVSSNGGDAEITLSGAGAGPVFSIRSDAPSPDAMMPDSIQDFSLTISNMTDDPELGDVTALTVSVSIQNLHSSSCQADAYSIVGDSVFELLVGEEDQLQLRLDTTGLDVGAEPAAVLKLQTDVGAAFGDVEHGECWYSFGIGCHVVPEPSTWVLGIVGIVGLIGFAQRRR